MEVVVVVEIPRGGRSKFEIEPGTGTIWLDRVLSTSTRYPAEYGFVEGTAGDDGDPLDAVLLVEEPTVPGCHVRVRPIGVLEMLDEHGIDPKLLCVALGDPTSGAFTDVSQVSPHLLAEIEHFFRVYKELEPRAFVRTAGWHGAGRAEALVRDHRARAEQFRPGTGGTAMVQLDLSPEQHELLREVLDHEYRDLRYEIADTNTSSFKEQLRQRAVLLRSVLDLVGGPLPDKV